MPISTPFSRQNQRTMSSSMVSPPKGRLRMAAMPFIDSTASSVSPPPRQISSTPRGAEMSSPAPSAAATGVRSEAIFFAPVAVMA